MIGALLLDIEGTTSSLEFVREVLFPHAREQLAGFIGRHRGEPAVEAELREVARIARSEGSSSEDPLANLARWMAEDRKLTPLKELQGLLWEEAFRSGAFVAPVYPDVTPALARFRAAGLRVYVYSSGSVRAQRAFFRHSSAGDLSARIDGWFDTRIGSKSEPTSYRSIAAALALGPEAILFVSDSLAELDAARAAGLKTTGVLRGPLSLGSHPAVTRFDELCNLAAAGAPRREASDPSRARDEVVALAHYCQGRGWAEATSGNFSVRVGPDRFAITTSGVDKGRVTSAEVLLVTLDGAPLEGGIPSAETPLHAALYQSSPEVGAVVHTHSVAGTVLSRRFAERGTLRLSGYEMAKALTPAIEGEPPELLVPIVNNQQDTRALAEAVSQRLARTPAPAYLVRGHGLTTWGKDAARARRHAEAIEFMLACELAVPG